jgi:hypothetical protein
MAYQKIREGKCCNLYFDIEFLKVENPHIMEGRHEEELMRAFMKLVGREIQLFFSLPFRVRRRHFVDLDSSDDRKFSRHLVLRLPDNYAFPNTSHCGHFVRMIHHKLLLLRQLYAREGAKAATAKGGADGNQGGVGDDGLEQESIEEPLVTNGKHQTSREMLDRMFVTNGALSHTCCHTYTHTNQLVVMSAR